MQAVPEIYIDWSSFGIEFLGGSLRRKNGGNENKKEGMNERKNEEERKEGNGRPWHEIYPSIGGS